MDSCLQSLCQTRLYVQGVPCLYILQNRCELPCFGNAHEGLRYLHRWWIYARYRLNLSGFARSMSIPTSNHSFRLGPEMVPLPIMSPLRTLQPFTVWCANCCTMDQYMYLKLERHTRFPPLKVWWWLPDECHNFVAGLLKVGQWLWVLLRGLLHGMLRGHPK